jgi:hypothetical protein
MKKLLGFYLLITALAFVFWGLDHYYLNDGFLRELDGNRIGKSYLFVYISTLAGYSAIHLVGNKAFDKVGFAFAAVSLLKMGAAIIFIYVLLPENQEDKTHFAFHFMAIYFLFLIVEMIVVSRLLRAQPPTANE